MLKFNPYLEVILAATIWGSSGTFIKYLNVPPEALVFLRALIPSLLFLAFLLYRRTHLFHGNMKIMMVASSLNAARMYLYVVALTYASIGNAVIMLYTWPIFASLYGILFFKEAVTAKKVLLLAMAFTGILFVYGNRGFSLSDDEVFGMSMMLLHSILYAFTVVIFKKESVNYSWQETIFYQNLVACFVFLPFIVINDFVPTLHQFSVMGLYAFLIGIVAFGLFFSALGRLETFTVSVLAYIEVISAIIFAMVFFGEALTLNMIAGGGLIISSTILLRTKAKKAVIRINKQS